MKANEITSDANENNGRQPGENERKPVENERQMRDHLRRQLLEEAKNKQLEKKMKKAARKKARNKKPPEIATTSGQTSAGSSPIYTSSSNGCYMEKTLSSLQNDGSMVASDVFDHHKPLGLESDDIFNNNVDVKAVFTTKTQQNMDHVLSDVSFSVQNSCNNQLATWSQITDGETWTAIPEVIYWPRSQSKIEKWILWYHRLTLDKRTKAIGKLRDSIAIASKRRDSMMLDSAEITPNEGKRHMKYVFSLSAELQHLQSVSLLTLPARGHCCLTYNNLRVDRDVVSSCDFGTAQHCGTNQPYGKYTDMTAFYSTGSHISECVDLGQQSLPCVSLAPSGPASNLCFPHKENAETEKCSSLQMPQFQRHLPLFVDSQQVQRCNFKIIFSNLLSQYNIRANTRKENLKNNLGKTPYSKSLPQSVQQRRLQAMLTKSLNESKLCALLSKRFCQNLFTSWPSHPVLKDRTHQVFSSRKRSCLKQVSAASSSEFQEQVPEKMCETSDDAIDIVVHKCKLDYQSWKSWQEMRIDMLCEHDGSLHTVKTHLAPSCSSFSSIELANVDEAPQNAEGYTLTAAERNVRAELYEGNNNHTSDEGYVHGEDSLNDSSGTSDLWCPIRQEFVPDNWDDGLSSDEDAIGSTALCVLVDINTSMPTPAASVGETSVETGIEIDSNEKQLLDVEVSQQNSSCLEMMTVEKGVRDNKPNQTTDIACDVNGSASVFVMVDFGKTTPTPTGSDEGLCVETGIEIDSNEQQLLDVEVSEQNSCWPEVVKVESDVCENKSNQTTDVECDVREVDMMEQFIKTFGAFHHSLDVKSTTKDGAMMFLDVKVGNPNVSSCPEGMKIETSVCENKSNLAADIVWDEREVDESEHCERINGISKLTSVTVPPLFPYNTAMEIQHQRKDKSLHKEYQLLNKTDLKWHQSTDLGPHTEAERNTDNEQVWPTHVSNESQTQGLPAVEQLTHQLNHFNVDGAADQRSEQCESISYLSKSFGALQNSLDRKAIEDGVMIKGSELHSANNPIGSSIKNVIPGDSVNIMETRALYPDKEELQCTADVSRNGLAGKCFLNNSVSVNHITGHKYQPKAEECPLACLTQGNLDNFLLAACDANKQTYNSDLPVNNESIECSVYTDSNIITLPEKCTAVRPTSLHPSPDCASSNHLCPSPSKSDVSNLIALTLEKERELLYLLLCDLQAKVTSLARVMNARNIMKSSLSSAGDVGSSKNAGLLLDNELSFEQIEAILDRCAPVAKMAVISASQHTSTESIQSKNHAQKSKNTFPLHYKKEKQVEQRELSDVELDNILKRLHILGVNELKTPCTSERDTAQNCNQNYEVRNLNKDSCANDSQLQSRLPKCPSTCEQRHWVGEATTQFQAQVCQNNTSNNRASSCKDRAAQFIQHPDNLSRNAVDVTGGLQELQGQFMTKELQSGNPRMSHAKTRWFNTVDSPCKSTEENRENIPQHKNKVPQTFLRKRMSEMPDNSLSERGNRETGMFSGISLDGLPKEVGSLPKSEKHKSVSLSESAVPVLGKNAALQKTQSARFNYLFPFRSQRPALTVSKTLPKKADEFCSCKDNW
ncbi:hypothetical protein BsWGS_10313 [Bradybaena similaris]